MAKVVDVLDYQTPPKSLILGCGALAHDLVRLIKQNPAMGSCVELKCLPAKLHNTPQLIAPEVEKFLQQHAMKYDNIFVTYGDCGTAGKLDTVLAKYKAVRLEGSHCYEFFAGSDVFNKIIDAEIGSFFLTDYLVKNFKRLVFDGLGLDRYPELFDLYFEHYKKIVYLAQTKNEALYSKAKQIADKLGWEFEYRLVGIDGLVPVVNYLLPIKKSCM